MRFNRDARKCVVYLGYPDHSAGSHGIRCEGTGFLLVYENGLYLVTAGHVARNLGNTGFVARVNKKDGTSANVEADIANWVFHPDYPSVDVAVVGFGISAEWGFDFLYLDAKELILTADKETVDHVEVGDLCYTVGLFRVLAGDSRNLPVVHTGHIARLPGEEKIPIKDRDQRGGSVLVDGYLVEAQTLSGLSGAPVFIRPSCQVTLNAAPEAAPHVPKELKLVMYEEYVSLLGLWQAAWEAPAGEVVTLDRGRQMTVPVGMGVVVPASRIVEILEMPDLKKKREAANRRQAENNATFQAISSVAKKKTGAEPAAANPDHKADFRRLLNAAVKGKPEA